MVLEKLANFLTNTLCEIAAWISGLVQTLLYADFFYYYFQRWCRSFSPNNPWVLIYDPSEYFFFELWYLTFTFWIFRSLQLEEQPKTPVASLRTWKNINIYISKGEVTSLMTFSCICFFSSQLPQNPNLSRSLPITCCSLWSRSRVVRSV